MASYVLFLLFLSWRPPSSDGQFIDPLGWNEGPYVFRDDGKEGGVPQPEPVVLGAECAGNGHSSDVMLRRLVALVLNTAGLEYDKVKGTWTTHAGYIRVQGTRPQLAELADFLHTDTNLSLRELDTLLSDLLHPYDPDGYSWLNEVAAYKTEIILAMCITMLLIVVYGVALSHHPWRCIFLILVIILTATYMYEFSKALQEARAQQRAAMEKYPEVPLDCRPHEKGWYRVLWEAAVSMLVQQGDECQEYYKNLEQNLLPVSPTRVLVNVLSDMIFYPLEQSGRSIAAFSSHILNGDLSFLQSWLVFFCTVAVVSIVLMLAVTLLCGGRVRLATPLVGVEMAGSNEAPTKMIAGDHSLQHSASPCCSHGGVLPLGISGNTLRCLLARSREQVFPRALHLRRRHLQPFRKVGLGGKRPSRWETPPPADT